MPRRYFLTIDPTSIDKKKLESSFAGQIELFQNIPVASVICEQYQLQSLTQIRGVLRLFDALSPSQSIQEPESLSIPYKGGARTMPYEEFYLNVLKAIDNIVSNRIKISNLSMRPPVPYPYSELEPMNTATKELASKGLILVVAAGNEGASKDGSSTLNPWSLAPWVIGVGTAYEGGKKMWENSSVGVPGDSVYQPWIVTPGADINVPDYLALFDQLHQDPGVPTLWHGMGVLSAAAAIQIPRARAQVASGSSFAAPYATRLVNYITAIFRVLQFNARFMATSLSDAMKHGQTTVQFSSAEDLPSANPLMAQLLLHGCRLSF